MQASDGAAIKALARAKAMQLGASDVRVAAATDQSRRPEHRQRELTSHEFVFRHDALILRLGCGVGGVKIGLDERID